jgi:hypothetical protein
MEPTNIKIIFYIIFILLLFILHYLLYFHIYYVHGSVHHYTIFTKMTNKMQLCRINLLFLDCSTCFVRYFLSSCGDANIACSW